ncbi:MAG: hypothetical protein ACLQVI_19240 [Polyangiaceae bacterium]
MEERRSRDVVARIEALASGFVALLALLISAYTVYLQRIQLKAALWPRVEVEMVHPDDTHFTISLKNKGVAPAEIRAVRVAVAGEATTDWKDWIVRMAKKQGASLDTTGSISLFSVEGEVLAAGEDYEVFKTDSPEIIAMVRADEDTRIEVCFCSTLDDCWLTDDDRTSPVEHCPIYATKFLGIPPRPPKGDRKPKRPEDAPDAARDAR